MLAAELAPAVDIAFGYRSLTPIVESTVLVESVEERRKESSDSLRVASGKLCLSCCFRFLGASGRLLMSKYDDHCSGLTSGGGLDLELDDCDLLGRGEFGEVLSWVLGLARHVLTIGAEPT